ncbi:MAG: acetamidase/formamidase family protein [Thermomicrobiaceae bacterium]
MTASHHVSVDAFMRLADQADRGHNRWHEAIPALTEVEPGDTVSIETLDAIDGQLTSDSTSADVAHVDLSRVHPLTGPVAIKGAEPGDLLEIKLLGIEADPWENWGFTAEVPGFGFLRDLFPDPYLVHWHLFEDYYAESPQIPGVRIPYSPFPGIVGLAPSEQLRVSTTHREQELIDRGGMCLPPEPSGAVPSGVVASEGLRTIPPRETGGNIDIKQLTPGSSLFLPVYTPGGLVSVGDVHYAQGDCEACGTAIEMRSVLHMRFHLHKGEAERKNIRFPQFSHSDYFTGTEMAVPRRFYATTGMPVHPDGRNEAEDLSLAARNALISMIDHLEWRGFDRQQAYAICSVAVDLKVSQVVDAPNFIVSAILPLDIFI